MVSFRKLFGDISEGAADNVRAGIADVQNTYVYHFLAERQAPITAPTGEMERSVGPEEPKPMSYGAALRKHSDLEQAEIRARHEVEQAKEAEKPDLGPEL